MTIGRGGFGNHMEAQREKVAVSDDVEAQRAAVEQQQPLERQPTTSDKLAEYAFRSRGGAGNWYSPKELAATGKFETGSLAQEHGITAPAAQQANPLVRIGGRGGSGNYAYANDQAEKQTHQLQADEDEKKRRIQAAVAQDVEVQLAFPAKVRTPAGED